MAPSGTAQKRDSNTSSDRFGFSPNVIDWGPQCVDEKGKKSQSVLLAVVHVLVLAVLCPVPLAMAVAGIHSSLVELLALRFLETFLTFKSVFTAFPGRAGRFAAPGLSKPCRTLNGGHFSTHFGP